MESLSINIKDRLTEIVEGIYVIATVTDVFTSLRPSGSSIADTRMCHIGVVSRNDHSGWVKVLTSVYVVLVG